MKDVTNAQVQSAIKRINQRLTELENAGWQDSLEFSEILELGLKIGAGIKHGSTGRPSLDIPRINKLSETDKQLLTRKGKKRGAFGSIGHARDKARKEYYDRYGEDAPAPNDEQLKSIASKNKEIHEFIISNADNIYKVEALYDAVHKPRRLTYQEADDLLNMYSNPDYYDKNGVFKGDGFKGDVSVQQEGQKSKNKK